jgi:hypothetical protein
LTGTVLALALVAALGTDGISAVVDQGPALTIDPCVEVDEATVRQVVELELRGARLHPASVTVQCIGGAQEIRVRPWTAQEGEGVRTIQLAPLAEGANPAARQARSRELALAIAEFIRRQDVAPPPPAPKPVTPPVPTPPVVSTINAPPAPPAGAPEHRWRLGILAASDYFSGGKMLAGGDLLVGSRLGDWFLAELRVGGRFAPDTSLPGGRLTARAGTAAAAVGLNVWSRGQTVGTALLLRAQGYLVAFRAEASGGASAKTAILGALALAAEPRFMLAITRRFSLEASAALGFLPRGIVVRTQGAENQSISGLTVSGSLGGVFTF